MTVLLIFKDNLDSCSQRVTTECPFHMVDWGAFLALLCGKVWVDSALEKLKRKTHNSFSVLVGGVEILAECKTWVSDLVSQQCCGIASVKLQKNKVSRSPL